MKILIESHVFAPEMNKAWLHPKSGPAGSTMLLNPAQCVRVPGCTTTKEVREKHFAPLQRRGHFVTITATYPDKHRNLNRTYRGMVRNLAQVRTVLDERRRYHNVPGAVVTAKLELVG